MDERVIRLIRLLLSAMVVMPDGTKVTIREGTRQGSQLSPCPSNIILYELDWELTRRGLRFVRYADDADIFARGRRTVLRVRPRFENF